MDRVGTRCHNMIHQCFFHIHFFYQHAADITIGNDARKLYPGSDQDNPQSPLVYALKGSGHFSSHGNGRQLLPGEHNVTDAAG